MDPVVVFGRKVEADRLVRLGLSLHLPKDRRWQVFLALLQSPRLPSGLS